MAVKKAKGAKKPPVKKAGKAKKAVAVKKGAVKKDVKKTISKAIKKNNTTKPAKNNKPKKAPVAKKAVKKVAVKKKKTVQKPVSQKPPVTKKPIVENMKAESTTHKMASKIAEPEMFDEAAMIEAAQTTTSRKPTTLLGSLEFTPYQTKVDEIYMNDRQKDHFRKILDAWKQQLMQDVDLTVGHLKEEAVFYADPVDRAAQEEGFNLELRTRDRERKLIKKIEQSLDLLNTGEYGFCEDCGAEIGIRRLEARPTAVKCIDCKTFQEIREKQLGG